MAMGKFQGVMIPTTQKTLKESRAIDALPFFEKEFLPLHSRKGGKGTRPCFEIEKENFCF
jgi:hypothetical protein